MTIEREILLTVGGMNCAGCARGIEVILKSQPGVTEARVNFATHEARVVFAPPKDPQSLVDAIRKGGYQAELPIDPTEDPFLLAAKKDYDEAKSLFLRATVAAVLGVALLVITSGLMPHNTGADPLSAWFMQTMAATVQSLGIPLDRVSPKILEVTSVVLGLLVLVGPGRGFFTQSILGLRFGRIDMNTLVAMGSLVAWLASVGGVVWPHGSLGHGKAAYFEGVAWLIAFVLFGKAIEHRAKSKGSDAVRALFALKPDTARRIDSTGENSIPLKDVRLGDQLRVLPGERVPVDGEILQGTTEIDEALLTGEPLPAYRSTGDKITGGTLNLSGSILMVARVLGSESVVGRLAQWIRQAQGRRAPIEALADRISAIFVPIILLLSLITLLAWSLTNGDWGHALARAVALLVVACPCALGLAMPVAVVSALGHGARMGILFKGGDALANAAGINHIVFDKTGTLTLGVPRVVQSWLSPEIQPNTLALAKGLAKHSGHPLAKALCFQLATEPTLEIGEGNNLPGQGIQGRFQNQVVRLGRIAWLKQINSALEKECAKVQFPKGCEGTLSVFSVDDKVLAGWVFEDTVRPEVATTVTQLKRLGLGLEIVSGDQPEAVARLAKEVGIESYHGSVSPEGKLQHIIDLQNRSIKVAMVGDGLNDGPALAMADVGMAMAQGADLAILAADVTLMRPNLELLPKGIVLARRTKRIIHQNLLWAFGYNLVALPFAAGLFEPLVGYSPGPALAGLAMALSSVTVVLNSLRLLRE